MSDACRDAIQQGSRPIVKLFLKEGLNANACAHKKGDSGGVYPLKYFAAKIGKLDLVQLLVKKGARITDDSRFPNDPDNQEAMRAAIKGGHVNVVQYLLEKGGDANGTFKKAP